MSPFITRLLTALGAVVLGSFALVAQQSLPPPAVDRAPAFSRDVAPVLYKH